MNVTFTIPGKAVRAVDEGNWPTDNPTGYQMIRAGIEKRVGVGFRLTVTMAVEDADDLANYLLSVAEVEERLTTAEGKDFANAKACRKAAAAIEQAVGAIR